MSIIKVMSIFNPVGYFQSLDGQTNFIEVPVNSYIRVYEDALIVSDIDIDWNILLPENRIIILKSCRINSNIIIEIPKNCELVVLGCTLNQNCEFRLMDETAIFSMSDHFYSNKINFNDLPNTFTTNGYIAIITLNAGRFVISGQIITPTGTNPGIYSGSRGIQNIYGGMYLTDSLGDISDSHITIGMLLGKNSTILPPININYVVEIIIE